jgi:eukaryotic-like serine/threonine-protein kinase
VAERLKNGPLPFDGAIRIALAGLEALDALHHRQIFHRDLKPSNVFLTSQGVKLLDLGVARSRDTAADVEVTAAGTVIGTPRYMAPEQWTEAQPDARSDLSAVGVLMYEMLTGRPAFPGDDLRQHSRPPAGSRAETRKFQGPCPVTYERRTYARRN